MAGNSCYDRAVLRAASQHSALSQRESSSPYTRKQVCRLLQITERQLRSWENQQLIPALSEFHFSDLLALRTLMRLRESKIPPRSIRKAIHAMRDRLKDVPNLLTEVRIYTQGNRVRVQVGKHKMEPVSGQLLFDFDDEEIKKLLELPKVPKESQRIDVQQRQKFEADRWFEKGLDLEQRGAPIEEVIAAYQKAVALDPHSAGALVNLGTIYFNGHAWADAEEQYKKALEIDPHYPLAHFNLGNLYDERGDYANALFHYQTALKLQPGYADAYYNLALLYQSLGETLNAVRYWKTYLKQDPGSSWAQIARRELSKLESGMVLKGKRADPRKPVPISTKE